MSEATTKRPWALIIILIILSGIMALLPIYVFFAKGSTPDIRLLVGLGYLATAVLLYLKNKLSVYILIATAALGTGVAMYLYLPDIVLTLKRSAVLLFLAGYLFFNRNKYFEQ